MANICTTQVDFYASPKAIEWLDQEIEKIKKADNVTDAFAESFKTESDLQPDGTISNIIDTIGAKWITISDWGKIDETQYYLNLETAWHYPKDLMERIAEKLQKMTEESGEEFTNPNDETNAMGKGRYWDETFDPIGVFVSYGVGNTDEAESSIDEDQFDWEEENPEGFFWDEVIEPEFESLENEI
jgi:hypothetical protein